MKIALNKIGMLTMIFMVNIFFNPNKMYASHLAAADIDIKYIGAGQDGCSGTTEYKYEVKLRVYRACEQSSAGLGSNETVQFASINGAVTGNIPMANPIKDTLDDLCDAFKSSNSCRIPSNQQFPGFVRHTYTGTITLPSAQTDWRFWWSSGARNGGIDNISTTNGGTSPQGNIYVEAGLNNLAKYNNSTPSFEEIPLPYICVNQPANYLNRPVDVNGDSLRIYSQTPLQGQNNPYFYRTDGGRNYSAIDPVGIVPGSTFFVDSFTGTASFTPASANKLVLAFRCDEYERGSGIRLGYIMRDVQISVFNCSAPPPGVDSLPLSIDNGSIVDIGGKKGIIACPGSTIKFSINTKSQNPTSNIFLEAILDDIPGSSFNVTGAGTSAVSGTFEWTPTIADIGETTLTIKSKDSTCTGTGFSIVMKNSTVLLLKIVGGLDAGKDLPFCTIDPKPVQLFVKGTEYVDFTWTTPDGGPLYLTDNKIPNPIASPPHTTTYVVSAPQLVGACKNKDTVVVFEDETNKVRILPENPTNAENALVLCRPGYVQLEALLAGRPPKNNVGCGTSNPTLCNAPLTGVVYGSSVYGTLGYDTLGNVTPVLYNTLKTTKYQFLIRRRDMQDADINSATLRTISFETKGISDPNYIYGNFRMYIKCTDKNALIPSEGFENFGLTEIYSASNVNFADGVHTFPLSSPYNWDTTKNLVIVMCFSDNPRVEVGCGVTSKPPAIKFAPTIYTSGLILQAADTFAQSVCGIDKNSGIKAVSARPVFTFTYCEADPLPFEIVWTEGAYLTDTNILQPLAYVDKSARYVVQTMGRSGCVMRDTLEIYVPNHDIKVVPGDTAICYGDRTPISIYGGSFYKWYEFENGQYIPVTKGLSCTNCAEPVVSPEKSTTYRIVVSDSVFCYDTVGFSVEIMPLPDVRILNQDTVLKYGRSFQLMASGAKLYNWSPVSSLNNPNISYPIAQPTEDTRYVVGGIASNGCRAFDTVFVTMDNRDNLFVPGAFSPNGDGKNDRFEVTNLTFQRIMEFRVFNRWGQEVFNTTDSRRGWDGTWNGEPQNIGNYSYLIRVGYPDGFVETYKGDVTLVR